MRKLLCFQCGISIRVIAIQLFSTSSITRVDTEQWKNGEAEWTINAARGVPDSSWWAGFIPAGRIGKVLQRQIKRANTRKAWRGTLRHGWPEAGIPSAVCFLMEGPDARAYSAKYKPKKWIFALLSPLWGTAPGRGFFVSSIGWNSFSLRKKKK